MMSKAKKTQRQLSSDQVYMQHDPGRTEVLYMDTGQILDIFHQVADVIKKKAQTLEELLPDFENYLRTVLAKEKLSTFAEKRRKYYVERLDVVKFHPPSPPPRPDGGLIKFHPGTTQPNTNTGSPLLSKTKTTAKINGHVTSNAKVMAAPIGKPKITKAPPKEEENIYADMDESEIDGHGLAAYSDVEVRDARGITEDCYLEPEEVKKANSLTASSKTGSLGTDTQKSWSDSESGTSYESYGEEDQDDQADYVNQEFPHSDDVPLPKVSKKKRKKKKPGQELPISDLPNVTFKGDLYHKGSWSWNKRYCVISDNRMLVYKSDKDTRPLINFVLLGYDIVYIEKEGRRSHVIRISHQGCESQFFAADLKEIADLWLAHLNPAATAESSSSGDSTSLLQDSGKGSSTADQHSISTGNMSGSASEGGSGDGVVTQSQAQTQIQQKTSPKNSDDKKVSASDKKKKNILSDILGTFGKKKEQKPRRRTIEITDIMADPEAVMAGILDVCHEVLTKNEWCPKYCSVKPARLECYHNNVCEGVELTLPLPGADIQSAGKETGKDLSIKLTSANGETIMLDTSDTIAQGKWLHALIKETEGIKDDTDSGALYENQEVLERLEQGINEDLYDDIDDALINGKRGSLDKRASLDKSSAPPSKTTSLGRSSSGASDSSQGTGRPPPLPSTDPPKRPMPSKKRRSIIDQDGENEIDLSEEIATAFSNIKSQLESKESRKSSSLNRGKTPPKDVGVTKVKRSASDSSARSDDNSNVVKCHLGPTIAEDIELFETTKNPILSELRKGRGGSVDHESLSSQIDDLHRKLVSMKKQKSDLRSKILTSRVASIKQRLETELQKLDQLIEKSEQEVTKLQLLAQDKGHNSSHNSSASSSRSNSFRQDSKSSPRNNPNKPLDKDSKDKTGFSSPKSQVQVTRVTSPRTITNKLDTKSVNKVSSAPKVVNTTASSMSKTWSKTTSTSNTTKQAVSRWNTGTEQNSNNQRKNTVNTSIRTDSPKVGQTRVRTVTTTTSVRSRTGQNGTNGKISPPKDDDVTAKKYVRDKLKLWESMNEDSTC